MDDLRIPPAVTFNFEQIVSKICDEAKVDYDERPFIARELQNHLNQAWRREIANGKSTDDAETFAIAAFGNIEQIAKSIRQPFWRRLLFFERYKAERYLWFLTVGIMLQVICSIVLLTSKTLQIGDEKVVGQTVGHELNPVYAILALLIIKWNPQTLVWKIVFFPRYALLFYVINGFYNIFFCPAINAVPLFKTGLFTLSDWVFLTAALALIIGGWIGGICYLSELFSWPKKYVERRRSRLAKNPHLIS